MVTDQTDSETIEPENQPASSPFQFEPPKQKQLTDPREAHQRMLDRLDLIRRETNDTIDWLGDAGLRRKVREFEQLPATASIKRRFRLLLGIADLQLRLGRETEAIDSLHHARDLLAEGNPTKEEEQELTVMLHFKLGVAHMRRAETENCCSRNTPDSCVVPIQGGGIHTNPRGSQQAIKHFEIVLKRAPTRSGDWLRAMWLLNVAHMTLGQYPGEVPEQYRLPESMFISDEAFPEFTNVAQERGVDTFSLAGGAIADDFDGDGDWDLVVSSLETTEMGQLKYFSNDGTGHFEDHSKQAGLDGLYGGLNLVHADFNNDGFLDVYVLRGGWFALGGRHPNSLLQNNGDGTFTDVTFAARVSGDAPTQTASWADYDNDGDLDLYVGNEYSFKLGTHCQLFRNEGDGTFAEVGKEAGVGNLRYAKSVIWGDYDHDGWADLFVSNMGEPNRLYRNRGDGTFEDVAPELDVAQPLRTFPSWFWDFDNDGHLDLLVTGYADDVAYEAAEQMGMLHDGQRPRLFRNDGKGGFVECAKEFGVDAPVSTMGSNFGDLNNDGFLDFYIGTGEPNFKNLMPNRMYLNKGGKGFSDVTMAGRFGHLQKGHGIVFADLDRDGDLDVFEQMGGAFPGDRFYDALYDNPGFGNNYLAVRLIGKVSNRFGMGARICVITSDGEQESKVYRTVNGGGTFGCNPLTRWFGLGKADRVDRVEIFWPATGATQIVENIDANQTIQIEEDS